jgi:DNA-binding transcriptional MerR regulator
MRQADLLDPVDIPANLERLDFYLGQVCTIAGISKIQLDYWTDKAAIPTRGRVQRTYDMAAVELVMLIKQAKDKGMTLPAAIEAAREFQARGAQAA